MNFLLIVLIIFSATILSAQSRDCKRNGSEPRHPKLVEQQVLALNREYSEMIQRGDVSEIGCVLADDYVLTDESGKLFSKADDLATYSGRKFVITKAQTITQKARIVGRGVVIVHTTVNFKGTRESGPFDLTEQCTTIWAWRDGRWQIISDHISFVKK